MENNCIILVSLVFEYVVQGKPIVAGLTGNSAQFITENVKHGCLFNPGDVDGCVKCIQNAASLIVDTGTIDRFIEKYSRVHIMEKMADYILSIASSSLDLS